MSTRPSTTRLVRTIRLTDEGIARIIAKLDSKADRKGQERRKSGRYPYRVKGVVVHMRQPGSGILVPYLVPTRDISARGLSFLHGGFVHAGTDCVVQLISREGAWKTVVARVVRCRFLESNVHEVGIQFQEAVCPSEFTATARRRRVLVIDSDPLMVKLASFHLQQLETEVSNASGIEGVMQAALEHSIEALILSAKLPQADALRLIHDLRAADASILIAAAVAPGGAPTASPFYGAGADLLMAHPYRREELVRIAEILGSDNLLQDCPAHPGNRGSLLKLLNAVPAHHERIAAAMDRNDTIQVVELTAVLRLEAEHEGCKPVARLCSRLESFAQARGPANGRSVLDEILIMALHLRYAVRRVGQA